ncbi:MAG: prolyl-tRNA synthetase associated domain-containing protein [Clostridia bacterium]|nr:prolyl-tRNA synthetase associated domain-containing protein [Clostridia bacterium]
MYIVHQGAPDDARAENEAAVYRFLNELAIPFSRIDHEPVHTMEDCAIIGQALGGEICKNLFLCNQQRTTFYLLMIHETKSFKTKDISKQLGVSRLSFATPEHMAQYLHIAPGAVSPMGLLFDSAKDVRLVLDKDVVKSQYLGCHPCVNTSSIKLLMADFLNTYLPATGHKPTYVTAAPPENA